jgi:hypothetical protein
VLGVVHVPVQKATYFALAGKGAYVKRDGETKQVGGGGGVEGGGGNSQKNVIFLLPCNSQIKSN